MPLIKTDQLKQILCHLIEIVDAAGRVVMDIYECSSAKSNTKEDSSPVTNADILAHHLILRELEKFDFGWPIQSEESGFIPYADRENLDAFWLVDPLDGTKDFIARTDEFTINIALISEAHPIFGIVLAPAKNRMFFAIEGFGAYERLSTGEFKKLGSENGQVAQKVILVSGMHVDANTVRFVKGFNDCLVLGMGSSLKICLVAAREAIFYPRLNPTYEWDTAAAHIILSEAGGNITDLGGNNLKYNKPNMLNSNFIAFLEANRDYVFQQVATTDF